MPRALRNKGRWNFILLSCDVLEAGASNLRQFPVPFYICPLLRRRPVGFWAGFSDSERTGPCGRAASDGGKTDQPRHSINPGRAAGPRLMSAWTSTGIGADGGTRGPASPDAGSQHTAHTAPALAPDMLIETTVGWLANGYIMREVSTRREAPGNWLISPG